MAILATPVDTPSVKTVDLYREPFVAVTPASHSLAGEEELSLEDLAQLELLLLDDGHCLRDQIIDLCKLAGTYEAAAAQSVTRAASLATVVQLVVADMGSTLLPQSAVTAECSRPGLAVVPFDEDAGAQRTIGLAFRASAARDEDFEALGQLVTSAYASAVETG